jgi:hypothetical protein
MRPLTGLVNILAIAGGLPDHLSVVRAATLSREVH